MIRNRFVQVIPAFAGAFFLASSSVVAQSGVTPWKTGDVIVGIGDPASGFPGHYRVFTPQGVPKMDPDLVLPRTPTLTAGIDVPGDDWGYTTGCAVDASVPLGDLFTTTWNGARVGRFRQSDHTFVTEGLDGAGFEPLAPLPAFVASPSFNANAIVAHPEIPVGNPLDDIQEVESIAFDAAGNYFLGTLIELQDASQVPKGYAWLLKYSKAGALLGAWRVPAGATGVDWIDVAIDQTTVYYTSEDKAIRWINTAAQADGAFMHGVIAAPSLGSNPGALRLLPPGDGTGGFLVATFDGVYRLDGQGRYIRSYADAGNRDGGYFAMNLTPDGQYFWTATWQQWPAIPGDPSTTADVLPSGGKLYKFHIASGAKVAGPLDTGSLYASGLCIVREYVAAQNVCYVMNANGDAVTAINPDTGLEEPKTEACRAIPVCAAGDLRPECLPPGAPVLRLQDVTSVEGDAVDLQLQAAASSGLPLTFTVDGAPPASCAGNALSDCALQVSSGGRISGTISWNAFTGNVSTDAETAYTVKVVVRNTTGDVATGTFTWHVKPRNAPPVIMNPGDQTLALQKPAAVAIVARDPDAATDALDISVTGLPPGLSLPTRTAYGMGWALALSGTPTHAGTYQVTVTACDCETGGSHTPVSTTFYVTVFANRAPVCSAAIVSPTLIWPPNHALVPIAIRGLTDPDGDRLSITVTGITQDEPVEATGDGHTSFDASGVGTSVAYVRSERSGNPQLPGDGRLYQIAFTASDGKPGGTCTGTVIVAVPHDQGHAAPTDNGCRWNSVTGEPLGACRWLTSPARGGKQKGGA